MRHFTRLLVGENKPGIDDEEDKVFFSLNSNCAVGDDTKTPYDAEWSVNVQSWDVGSGAEPRGKKIFYP